MNFNVIGGTGGGGGGPVGTGGGAGIIGFVVDGGGGGGAFGLKRNRLRSIEPGFGRSASSDSRCTSGVPWAPCCAPTAGGPVVAAGRAARPLS